MSKGSLPIRPLVMLCAGLDILCFEGGMVSKGSLQICPLVRL